MKFLVFTNTVFKKDFKYQASETVTEHTQPICFVIEISWASEKSYDPKEENQ